MLVDELKKAEELVRKLKEQISRCEHDWTDPVKTQIRKTRPVGTGQYENLGVDSREIYDYVPYFDTGYERICKLCGTRQVTEKVIERTQVVERIPDFGK